MRSKKRSSKRRSRKKRSRRGSGFFDDIGSTFKKAFSSAGNILTNTPLKYIPGISQVGDVYKKIGSGKRKSLKHSKRRSRKSSKRRSSKRRSKSRVRIPISNKGGLLGYTVYDSLRDRRHHLQNAIKRFGKLKVFHRLNALVVFNKHRPKIRKVALSDRNWVDKLLKSKKGGSRKSGSKNYIKASGKRRSRKRSRRGGVVTHSNYPNFGGAIKKSGKPGLLADLLRGLNLEIKTK